MSSVSGFSSVLPVDVSSTSQKKTSSKAHATATGSSDSSTSTSTDSALTSSVGTTFMNLLVKELQNQDPTSPMDSTAMVGQMISLNQLDQLMSINEDLAGTTSSTSATSHATIGSAGTVAARAALANTGFPSAAASSSAQPASSNATSVLDLSGLPNTTTNGAN